MSVKRMGDNHLIINIDKCKYLVSYDSIVAVVNDEGKLTLGRNWDLSNTTKRFLYAFLEMDAYKWLNRETQNSLVFGYKMKKSIDKAIEDGIIKYDVNLY